VTSVCSGGVSSQRKTGVPSRIYADPAFVVSALPSQLGWLAPFVPYLPPIYFDVDAFCASEPPGTPTLVEATIAAVLAGGEAGATFVAAQLIWEVIQNQLWYQWCQCSSGTQPTAPTGQSAPTNLPAVNPPAQLPPAASVACDFSQSSNITWAPNNGALRTSGTLTTKNPTSYKVTVVQSVATAPGPAITYLLESVGPGPSHTILDSHTYVTANTVTDVHIFTVPVGTEFIRLTKNANGTAGLTLSQDTLEVFCNGNPPGGVVAPCCPPDPNLTGMMTQILQYVTLLQRQLVPLAYVTKTQHTGLSGAGTFDIQGLLGVLINVTSLPASYGRAGTSPTEYFELGFVTFGTDDGYPSAFKVERSDQLLLPARCSAFTNIAYDLSPGVTVTITELVREP
jgi:hypothetical protein